MNHRRRHPVTLGAAERARTLVAGPVEMQVGVCHLTHEVARHAVDRDGSLLFLAPVDSPSAVLRVAPRLPPTQVTVTATDVTGVPQPDRVRGTLRSTGTLEASRDPLPDGVAAYLAGTDPELIEAPGPVLRFRPQRISLRWRCETSGDPEWSEVPLEDYRHAWPDPLVGLEGRWLPHLQRDHAALLRSLAAQSDPGQSDAGQSDAGQTCAGLAHDVDVRPLGLDRFGIVLRLYDADGHRDTRVPFARPVRCGCDLHAAFAELVGTAD